MRRWLETSGVSKLPSHEARLALHEAARGGVAKSTLHEAARGGVAKIPLLETALPRGNQPRGCGSAVAGSFVYRLSRCFATPPRAASRSVDFATPPLAASRSIDFATPPLAASRSAIRASWHGRFETPDVSNHLRIAVSKRRQFRTTSASLFRNTANRSFDVTRIAAPALRH